MHDVADRLQASVHAPSNPALSRRKCNFSLVSACEGAAKAMVHSLSRRVEVACAADPRLSWDVHGYEPSGLKRVLLNLGEFYHSACSTSSLYAILVNLRQSPPRPPTPEEAARFGTPVSAASTADGAEEAYQTPILSPPASI